MKTYAICHKQCHDGLGGAYVAKKFNPDIEIFFTSRKNEWKGIIDPQIESGDFVYFIDYTPEPAHLEEFLKRSVDFLVLDHHDTDFRKVEEYDKRNNSSLMSYCKFDMSNAGTTVAWHHFFPGQEVPTMLQYISIADIYAWRGPDDHAVVQYIRTLLDPDASLEDFGHLVDYFSETDAKRQGGLIFKRINREVDFIAKRACLMDFDGVEVLAVNSSVFHSEIGHELALQSPSGLGVIYNFHPASDGVKLSVRGVGANGFAERYGGGGHPQAAGFYMSIDEFNKFLKTAKKNVTTEV